MLTSEKIINKLYKLNHGKYVFNRIGKEEDFVRTYISFKKYQKSLSNRKNGKGIIRRDWDNELHIRYAKFIHNVEIHKVCWQKKKLEKSYMKDILLE